jgi:hypothetical protein
MSEPDLTSTLGPQAPAPAPGQPPPATYDPAHPAYAALHQPRFLDRVLGMRAVIAVALAALIIGGLSGFLLGEHTGGGDDRFGHGGPGGLPGGQGFRGGPQGAPGHPGQQGQQNFGQGQTTP